MVLIPAGIGVPPVPRKDEAQSGGEDCVYPIRTIDPTGVLLIDPRVSARVSVGDFFDLWGQTLSRHQLAGFRAKREGITVFVNGRRVLGDPRAVALRPHAQIVLELGAHVDPHPSYRFPLGL
jgi:hypothetical protein